MNRLLNRLRIKRVMSTALCIFAVLSTLSVTNQAMAQNDDPLLKAMQSELEREKAQLVLPGMQRPYFIEYQMDDLESFEALANYGALTREETNHQRVVRVTVRSGDYTTDSRTSPTSGTVQLSPTANNPESLRYVLWTATDEAYKTALRAYATKTANLQNFQSAREAKDFAPAKAVDHVAPLGQIDLS